MSGSDVVPEPLLEQARAGDDAALGRLLELYRNYLRLMARSLIGGALRAKFDSSDVVQEAFLKAHADFKGFLGQGEPELVAWLRSILVHRLADLARHHKARGATSAARNRSKRCSNARAWMCSARWRA